MGGKKSKAAGDTTQPVKPLPAKSIGGLSDKDLEFLQSQTGLSKAEVQSIFEQFKAGNPDEKLDKKEFIRLYDLLRPEPPELLDEISDYVFRAFDTDHNGTLSFSEFLVAYALTSRGDTKKKLEYAFLLYDIDGNGYLDRNEVSSVILAMLDLLGADKKGNNPQQLAEECMKELDAGHDGKVSKDEFINGLLKNYGLRELLSPFN